MIKQYPRARALNFLEGCCFQATPTAHFPRLPERGLGLVKLSATPPFGPSTVARQDRPGGITSGGAQKNSGTLVFGAFTFVGPVETKKLGRE